MTSRCVLGLDLGTSGLKAVLVTEDGSVVAASTRPYGVTSPHPGWAETDPRDWEVAARAAVIDLVGRAPDVEIIGIGIDGQMHGTVLVDRHGDAVRNAILWPDARAAEEMPQWQALSQAQLLALANPLTPGMTGPVLGWLSRHEPEAMAAAECFVLPKDWVRSRLTGDRALTDPSDASATLLWNVGIDGWDLAVCESVGIDPRLLPSVLPSDAVAGHLDATTAQDWNLPAGIPVSVGCADAAATLLGAAAPAGRLTLTVGTGAQVILPGVTPSVAGPVVHHTYRAADDSYYAMAAVMNAGLALTRVVQMLGAEWDELYRRYDRTGAVPGFVPFLSGERLPVAVPASSGGWFDLGLQTERADLLAAALEGVAFTVRRALEQMPSAVDPVVDLAGGGSRSPVFAQLLVDVLGRPMRRVEHQDATVLGAARLAWIVAGHEGPPVRAVVSEVLEPVVAPDLERRYQRFIRHVDQSIGTRP